MNTTVALPVSNSLHKYLYTICNAIARLNDKVQQNSKALKSFANSKIRTIKLGFALKKKICQMGMTMTAFYREKDKIILAYKNIGRRPFGYLELLELQRIIEPEQEIIPGQTTVYPIPFGNGGEYTLYIEIPNWAT